MACMKHFALNSMENARFTVDVTVDDRALHEVYLPHFRTVAAAGVASVMSAYNSVNGEWCGQNEHLLTDILRDEWGWDGFVISDFNFGLRDAVRSVSAGLDIEMPFRQQRAMELPAALERGALATADVASTAVRVVATLLRCSAVYEQQPPLEVVGSDVHRTLAREAASASTVLLRNEAALLPLDPSAIGTIAVVGRLGARRNLGDGGSSDVRATDVVTALDGLRTRFGSDRVVHSDDDASVAAGADVAVVVVGYTKADEGECIEAPGIADLARTVFPPNDHPELGTAVAWDVPPGPVRPPASAGSTDDVAAPGAVDRMAPGGDRASLRLSDADESLIAAVRAVNPNVVVVVVSGSAVVMPWAATVPAVLLSWYSGVEGGAALAAILAGDAEPAGRLPFVIPTDPAHLPDFDRNATAVTYDLFHGQWKLDRDANVAHFPFGWGLGYATAEIIDAAMADSGALMVSLANRSDRDTSAVVFVHAGLEQSEWERPRRRLIGFARTSVPSQGSAQVEIIPDWAMLDVRVDGGWVTERGTYVVEVGRHAHDAGAATVIVERPGSGLGDPSGAPGGG